MYKTSCQFLLKHTPGASVLSLGHTPISSVTSYGHSYDLSDKLWASSRYFSDKLWTPPRVSVPLIARVLKKKLKMRTKNIFFKIFTMLILFLRVSHVIYVKLSLHVTVPLILTISDDFVLRVFWFLL